MKTELTKEQLASLVEVFGEDKVNTYLEIANTLDSVAGSRHSSECEVKIKAMMKVFDEHYIVTETGRVIERKSNPRTRK